MKRIRSGAGKRQPVRVGAPDRSLTPNAGLAVVAVVTGGDRQPLAGTGATVGRVLAEAKVRPHKVRGWLNRADDPSFWIRAGAVCRLYLNPPPGTVLIRR